MRILKRLALLVLAFVLLSAVSGCSSRSSSSWEARYNSLEERYAALEEKYYALRRAAEDAYFLSVDSPSTDICVDIASKHDKAGVFPPYTTQEDLETILYCYVEGEPYYTRFEVRLAYAAYKEYTSEIASRLSEIHDLLSRYY